MKDKNSSGWGKAVLISFIVFLLCFIYAFIRYNVVRNVVLDQLPLYILNKAVALATTIIIGSSFLLGPLTRFFPKTFTGNLYLRKPLGLIGFAVAALHAIISLLIFDKAYYSRLFLENGKLTFIGETTMLFGILAFLIFTIIALVAIPSIEEKLTPKQWKSIQRLGYIAYMFVLLHVGVMGWRGWFTQSNWQYGLVTISLIAALFIVLVLLLRFVVILFPRKN